jgi:hypothetical protein
MSTPDIHMFGHNDGYLPKHSYAQVQWILPETPCMSAKITAGDAMG